MENSYLLQLWDSVSHQDSLVQQRKEGFLKTLSRGAEVNTTVIEHEVNSKDWIPSRPAVEGHEEEHGCVFETTVHN